MIFIRYALVLLIIYLLIRSFVNYFAEEKHVTRGPDPENRKKTKGRGVSKEIGEYVDYEEIDK